MTDPLTVPGTVKALHRRRFRGGVLTVPGTVKTLRNAGRGNA
jgi:hypothetical protein